MLESSWDKNISIVVINNKIVVVILDSGTKALEFLVGMKGRVIGNRIGSAIVVKEKAQKF